MMIPSGSFWGLCLLGCASVSPHENLESLLVPSLKLLQAANKPVQTPDSQGNPSKSPLSTTCLLAGVLSRQMKHWEEGRHNVSCSPILCPTDPRRQEGPKYQHPSTPTSYRTGKTGSQAPSPQYLLHSPCFLPLHCHMRT